MELMGRRNNGPSRSFLLPRLAVFGAALTAWGGMASRVQAAPAQASPRNNPADQHAITVVFDYDFSKNPSCAEKPASKTCIKQFVVYDASGTRVRLFSIPVPDSARGMVKGIKGQSPPRFFLPGRHLIAVTAQNAAGTESPVHAANRIVKIKSKTADPNSSPK
jgi:hypothetical protein